MADRKEAPSATPEQTAAALAWALAGANPPAPPDVVVGYEAARAAQASGKPTTDQQTILAYTQAEDF